MLRRWWCFVPSLLLAHAAGWGATVVSRTVVHTIQPDGALRRTQVEKVRLESDRDVERWSVYSVPLDDHITLEGISARATRPDGDEVVIDRKKQDLRQLPGPSELHSSRKYQVATFPALPVGSLVEVGHEVLERAYFPAERILLVGSDPVEELRVEIRGGDGSALRWQLEGPATGLDVRADGNTLVVTGQGLAGIRPPDGIPSGERYATLHYAWGEPTTWRHVADWYASLVRDLPRADPGVLRRAEELIAGSEAPWDKLTALVQYCQQHVRYVAVEVGIGGYRPTPPAETLDRKWGDCKDKSFLLLDLLTRAGIEAYPALVRGSDDDRINAAFPTPLGFNHLIVAVPEGGWMPPGNLPRSAGYLFVDPTQTLGGPSWLSPWVQGQDALVVRGESSELVRTPLAPAHESRDLTVDLQVGQNGDALGRATLHITGGWAARWQLQSTSTPADRTEEDVRDLFDDLLPGSTLGQVGWNASVEHGIPKMTLEAAFTWTGLVQGAPERRSFRMTGVTRTPEPRLLADRQAPFALLPVSARSLWRVRVPGDWCLPEAGVDDVDNPVGAFHQRVTAEQGRVEIERRLELRARWVEPAAIEALREVSIAERRAHKRRIRMRCSADEALDTHAP